MALLSQSLNAATALGPGTSMSFDVPRVSHTLFISVTGLPTPVVVNLEGTLDGVNWFGLATLSLNANNNSDTTAVASVNSNFPVISTRANLATLTDGTSPTVTAWIAAA